MKQRPHLTRDILVTTAIIALGAVIGGYLFADSGIPRAFFEERIRTAGAANNLALLVNNSVKNLSSIEQFVRNNSDDQALALISFEAGSKVEKQNAAVLLAGHLEQLAKAANEIKSGRARGLGLSAVTAGVSMVSRIVTYNSSMDQLFAAIQAKILNSQTTSQGSLRSLVSSINSDAQEINQLNNDFNAALKTFDATYVE